MKRLRITVTHAHIAASGTGEYDCPIALALQEAGFTNAMVTEDEIFLAPINITAKPSRRMLQFINDYDHGRIVHPSTFNATLT